VGATEGNVEPRDGREMVASDEAAAVGPEDERRGARRGGCGPDAHPEVDARPEGNPVVDEGRIFVRHCECRRLPCVPAPILMLKFGRGCCWVGLKSKSSVEESPRSGPLTTWWS